MMKKVLTSLGILVLIAGVYIGTKEYYTWGNSIPKENADVLVEKIKTVAKLVTVEAYFSEVYSYEDYLNDWQYSFFKKRALIRVKAKVSVGYDLTKMKITSLSDEKTIVLSDLPDPEIISIEHDLDYYDITEGTFNSFSKDDYNRMNTNAKEFIRKQAQKTDIFLTAESHFQEMQSLIKFMVEGAGWELKYELRDETTGEEEWRD